QGAVPGFRAQLVGRSSRDCPGELFRAAAAAGLPGGGRLGAAAVLAAVLRPVAGGDQIGAAAGDRAPAARGIGVGRPGPGRVRLLRRVPLLVADRWRCYRGAEVVHGACSGCESLPPAQVAAFIITITRSNKLFWLLTARHPDEKHLPCSAGKYREAVQTRSLRRLTHIPQWRRTGSGQRRRS